jgi:hypothetical protein
MAVQRRRRKFRKFTILSGTATGPEMSALQLALEEIEKNAHPQREYRSSWARLKISKSLPTEYRTTAP